MGRYECAHCNRRLSWLARIRKLSFCTPEHKTRYEAAIQEQMLARLIAQRKRLGLQTDSLTTVGRWILEERYHRSHQLLAVDPFGTTD